MQDHLELKL